jgi:hypothetical protein
MPSPLPPLTGSAFDLPAHLAPKADPDLIARDEQQFAAISDALSTTTAELTARLDELRRTPAGAGQAGLDRDLEIHRLTQRLRALARFRLDVCLGRIVPEGGGGPIYIGRFGLTEPQSEGGARRLLVDWRAPAAEPFFAATHADPRGLVSRRRYRWGGGRVRDYWDEVFTAEGLRSQAALDDQSAFIASLGADRSPRMRDVLSTIQADQDAVIRAGSEGALVVDGGPGTGKTVVALHRAAYLIYADPRLAPGRGGVLFVGPHEQYLAYVADVLPSLGEESVQTCTLRDLVREGALADDESDPRVAALKADARLVAAIEPAVVFYEEPPTSTLVVPTPWAELVLTAGDWAEAFTSPEPGTPHNEARDQVWETIVEILSAQVDDEEVPPAQLGRVLSRDEELTRVFQRAWPLVEASVLVADLWSVPAYLRRCAPWLTSDEARALQRTDASAWTVSDLPLLDAARRRLGDPSASKRRREREIRRAAEQSERARVTEELIAADDSEMLVMSMLKGQDFANSLEDESGIPSTSPDLLAGPFAHIVVDEAQELTDAEWRMLLARCPSRSFTVVGDRAQARHGFEESWQDRLARIGLPAATVASLTINYRTPEEVMTFAEPVIRAAVPDANVPTSIRASGIPVRLGVPEEREGIVADWLAAHETGEGVACVIGEPALADSGRVRSLSPRQVKGLEFDLVVVVDPDRFGEGIEGAVDRYVSMTRATQELVVLTP